MKISQKNILDVVKFIRWLTLIFVTYVVTMDIMNTMCGQTVKYFEGQHEEVNEGNIMLKMFGMFGPGSFGFGFVVHITLYWTVNMWTPYRIIPNLATLFLNINIAYSHLIAACWWFRSKEHKRAMDCGCNKMPFFYSTPLYENLKDALYVLGIILYGVYIYERFFMKRDKRKILDNIYLGFLIYFVICTIILAYNVISLQFSNVTLR